MVTVGGQTPLNIARELAEAGVKVIGTSTEMIIHSEMGTDSCQMTKTLGIPMPESGMASTLRASIEGCGNNKVTR